MKPVSSQRFQNQLLATLPAAEWLPLQTDLELVEMAAGTSLHEAGTPLKQVYFPTTAIVSLVSSMSNGASAEVAVVGSEGVVGVCAFMGGGDALSGAIVQAPGHALRMNARAVAAHSSRSAPLMRQLLRYTQALFTHMAQTSACNRHHELEQQLCRWLLLNLDRRAGNGVAITQERIASMLGVPRSGVTEGALKLQEAGLIRYSRGHISIPDRPGLEARSCECYSVVSQAYEKLRGRSPPGALGATFAHATFRSPGMRHAHG